MWLINNRNIFLRVLETGNLRPGCQCVWVSLGGLFWDAHWLFLTLSSHGERGKGGLWSLFYKVTNLFIRTPSLWPNHLPKAPLPNAITLVVRISIYGFAGNTDIQSMAPNIVHMGIIRRAHGGDNYKLKKWQPLTTLSAGSTHGIIYWRCYTKEVKYKAQYDYCINMEVVTGD